VYADNTAPVAVRTRVVLYTEGSLAATSKVVEPQLLTDGVANAPAVNSGNTSVMTSLTSRAAFKENWNAIEEALPVTGVATVSALVKSVVGKAGEDEIAVAPMSLYETKEAAAVRVTRFSGWDVELVVTPVETVILHCVAAVSVAPPTVNVSAAPEVPEPASWTEKIAAPHPSVEGVAKVVKVKYGNTMISVSLTTMSALAVNKSATADAVCVAAGETVRVTLVNAVGISVEVGIAVADIVSDNRSKAAVRLLRFAS